jgi:signal transduction histidine kinase
VESFPQFQPPHSEIIIEPNLPPVMGNETGLTQCFSNFLNNAVKFVPAGRTPQIKVCAERRGDQVRLWVRDNGIGIDARYHEKIWTLFHRLSKSYEGTGIGLALVHKVVERMNGKVGVESAPGEGSRFWIELKLGA